MPRLHADMGPRATGKEAVATVVVDKMRRRMRQNGYHAHITLQARQLPVQLPEAIIRECAPYSHSAQT